jgi:hypothetical protein
LVFDSQHGKIASGRNRARRQAHWLRRAGEEDDQAFQHGGCAAMDQAFRLGVSIPGLGHVAIGRQQTVADEKSSSGYARANRRGLVGKTDLIDPVNIADGIAIPVEHKRWHSLLLLEFRHLLSELLHLLVQFIGLRALGRDRRVVAKHGCGAGQQHHGQHGLHHLLPAVADLDWFLLNLRIGHERSSSLVRQGFSTVRKMMYRRCGEALRNGSRTRRLSAAADFALCCGVAG